MIKDDKERLDRLREIYGPSSQIYVICAHSSGTGFIVDRVNCPGPVEQAGLLELGRINQKMTLVTMFKNAGPAK